MIINSSYFRSGIRNIPNMVNSQTASKVSIDASIAKYEPKFLELLLGYKLARDFQAYANDTDENKTPIPRFDALLNGAEYTVNEVLYKTESIKESIADFVFFRHKSNTNTSNADSGEVLMQSENSTVISPTTRMRMIWNEMVEGVDELHEWMQGQFTIEGQNYPYINEYGL